MAEEYPVSYMQYLTERVVGVDGVNLGRWVFPSGGTFEKIRNINIDAQGFFWRGHAVLTITGQAITHLIDPNTLLPVVTDIAGPGEIQPNYSKIPSYDPAVAYYPQVIYAPGTEVLCFHYFQRRLWPRVVLGPGSYTMADFGYICVAKGNTTEFLEGRVCELEPGHEVTLEDGCMLIVAYESESQWTSIKAA